MKHHFLTTILRAKVRVIALLAALLGAASAPSAALAAAADSPPDNVQLLRLIEAQAQRIEQLEARLAALAEGASHAEARATAATAGAAQSANVAASAAPETVALAGRVTALEEQAASQTQLSWSRGGAPQFTSADGALSFRPRGRVLVDYSGTGGSRFSNLNNSGTEARSLRLGAEGAYRQISWVLEGDFADNVVAWKSAYLAFGHKLLGQRASLSVGNRLHDLGFDGSSGQPNVPFQERNVVGLTLQPAVGSFGLGLTESVGGEAWHASLSATGNDLNNPGSDNDTLTYRARAHFNPLKSDRVTLHLGAWTSYEELSAGQGSLARNWGLGGHFNDNVKTRPGALAGADRAAAYGLELGAFSGPFWAYGEYGQREIKAPGSKHDYAAYALSAGWFLTGARPAYNTRSGNWGATKVAHPVSAGGAGAWELKARYEALDYLKLPGGGEGSAWTFGVNWYLNNNSRVLFDAVLWEADNRSGAYLGKDDGYTLNTRIQLTF